jgi:hypothetical protein
MSTASHDPEYELYRWCVLVTLLSMDVVRPFCELMGLGRDEFEGLQRRLRQQLVTERKRCGPPPEASMIVMHQDAPVAAVAESLRANAGPHLAWWERHIFYCDTRDHRGLQHWGDVLVRGRHEPGLWQRLFPASIRSEALERFLRSLDLSEYNRREKEIDAKPLSDWDLHLYTLYLHDDILYGAEHDEITDGAKLDVELTIGVHQGYQFWAWVFKACDRGQLSRLWQEARRIVEEEKLTWVRDLPHPSVLDIWR